MFKINGFDVPEHISHSQLTTWLSCGWLYFLTRIANAKEQSSWWLVGGSAVHEATEAYDWKLWEDMNK